MQRKLELLAPAGNPGIAIDAIKHGADAVYIGPPSHGARKSASNSLDDIKKVVEFAHIYEARVYVTVNTLVYDREIRDVELMIRSLYQIGVDAIIVQDMGILRMDIPPIELHASTQCDIRTPEKARFLEKAGFSQLVLARELSVGEIRAICREVSVPVEVFVHGALCVSYSGRCSAGFACSGRSGNRGECPQICRQAFTLRDADGRVIARDKYLLSLKDLRADAHLGALIDAGVSSFKIEGRLKEAGYVKNVTAYYSRLLDGIIDGSEGTLRRSSVGKVALTFQPDVQKSFNRGFTDYRLSGFPDKNGIVSILTPKSLGEPISNPSELSNGDGISYFDRRGNYTGMLVNGNAFRLPEGVEIRRTSSVEWKKLMAGETATRTIPLDVTLEARPYAPPKSHESQRAVVTVTATDATGASITVSNITEAQKAQKPADYRRAFGKLGGTPFHLNSFESHTTDLFLPISMLTSMRREAVVRLLSAKKSIYRYGYRRGENAHAPLPYSKLDYRDNVANRLAEKFYRDHGATSIQAALETLRKPQAAHGANGLTVMTTRHCILRELGLCLKNKPQIKLPLELSSGKLRLTPLFDCANCEMQVNLIHP